MALTTVRSTGIGSLPAISGSNLTSLNASNISSGTLNSARFSGGKIGQFVRSQQTSAATVSSTTYTDIGLSVNITPSATSSKIIVMGNIKYSIGTSNTDRGFGVRCLRDSTNIGTSATLYDVYHKSTNSDFIDGGRFPLCLFDESANTTSQITYSFRIGAWNNQSVTINSDSNYSEIMCWELLA